MSLECIAIGTSWGAVVHVLERGCRRHGAAQPVPAWLHHVKHVGSLSTHWLRRTCFGREENSAFLLLTARHLTPSVNSNLSYKLAAAKKLAKGLRLAA